MNIFYYAFFIFLCSISLTSKATNIKTEHPLILDFYPNCSYEVLKNYTVNSEVDSTGSKNETTKELLLKLRKKANEVGAHAVILVKKNIEQQIKKNNTTIVMLEFKAELIKQCAHKNNLAKKRTNYNHLGDKIIGTIKTPFSDSNKIHRPKLNNKEISLKNGIYGLKLGEHYQKVIDLFGTPSSVFKLFNDEFIISYGRRHWLYFQSNKLVKVQTQALFLSQSIINEIPLVSFFDAFQWKINSKIAYRSQLSDIKESLNISTKLNNQNQLIIKNNTATLILYFSKYIKENSTRYEVKNFSLQSNSYKKPKNRLRVESDRHFNVLYRMVTSLNENQAINFDTIKSQLGKEIGHITLTKREKLLIYNNNLLTNIKNEKLNTVSLVEEVFLNDGKINATSQPWFLGNFTQGKSIDTLRPYFPADSFELYDKVEIDSDEYQLSLLFDEVNNDKLLVEAKITLY